MMTTLEGRPGASLAEFLYPAPAERSVGKIVRWWEGRRLFYNLAVASAGLVSLGVVTAVASLVTGHFLWISWQPVVIFGVMANVCYLLGPCIEIAVHELWGRSVLPIGPALYRMGLTFSVGLALLPSLIAVLLGVARVLFSLPG